MRRLPSRQRAGGASRLEHGRLVAGRLGARVASLPARAAALAARRATIVIIVAGVLAAAAGVLALGLDASAEPDTLVDRDDRTAMATERFHRDFGGEPIAVLVRGRSNTVKCEPACRLADLLLTEDLARIAALEGCLSGNVPRGARPLAPACTELGRRRPIQVVYGPGTFINESVRQVSSRFEAQRREKSAEAAQAARAAREVARARGLGKADEDRLARRARQLVYAQFARDALGLALSYGLTSAPSLNNPEFVLRLVFEPSLGAGVPKPRFAYLFPGERSALIQARLRDGLSEAEQAQAIALVREAVGSPRFRLERGEYVVAGAPVVASGVASALSGALALVLVATLVLTAAALLLASRERPRLLPLAPAIVAVALTAGVMSLAGVSLTIATIAVLPLTGGLAAGYALHLQRRFREARASDDALGGEDHAALIVAAALAAAAGFLAILLSPVPTVRSFGAFVVVGIGLSLVCAVMVGSALLGGGARLTSPLPRGARVSTRSKPARGRLGRLTARIRTASPMRAAARLHAVKRATTLLRKATNGAGGRVAAVGRRALDVAVRRPRPVLALALVAALAGWLVQDRSEVVSDLQRLAPGDLREVEDARTLQRETGVSGDVNVVVRGERLTSPAVVRWMTAYQERMLDRHGYSEERACEQAKLCPGLSVTSLFGSGRAESARRIRALLDALPPYFSRSVISTDRRAATIAFSLRAMPLEDQRRVIDDLRAELDPPAGVRAELAGSPVVAADANGELESSWRLLTLASLAFVFVLALALYRRVERAIVLLIPLVLASGWSALVVFALQIPVNPLSAALGALVVAVCAQLAVILSARYREERGRGQAPAAALTRAYERVGPAIIASAAVAIAGLAALIVSDVRMVRDFGFVAAVATTLALLGVMVVLPAALVWAEQWRPVEAIRSLRRRARRLVPAGARGARGGR